MVKVDQSTVTAEKRPKFSSSATMLKYWIKVQTAHPGGWDTRITTNKMK